MPDIFVAADKKITHIKPSSESLNHEKPANYEKNGNINIDGTNDAQDFSQKGMHLFSSFYKNPKGIYFKNQEKEEKILLFIRKSIITNFKWVFVSIVLLTLPFFAYFFLNFGSQIIVFPFRFVLFYYLIVFSYIYVNFITWYFNLAFVTNIRIIDIDFSGLIYKNIAATKLSLVQDVSFTQVGAIRTFFNYGDVFVQTAGTYENFEFEAAPQPENAVHIIEDLIGKKGHGII
ncbi:MAG: hypothetical protein HYT06_00765 [Candidatus Levybacteria bacterium]|nr:hypothetical protein [Candidatus Levybacteria bacterium]